MTFAEQLRQLSACPEAIAWVGERTLDQAWTQSDRGDWMAWLTHTLALDSRAAAADIAERVWHLVEPDSQLACAWAIDCARRGADGDEMRAAWDAAWDAARAAARDARAAAWAAADAADAAGDAARAAADAAGDAARTARAAGAAEAAEAAAKAAERLGQADIMRSHFTAAQIAEALERRLG